MLKVPDTYELIESYDLKDIASKGYLLEHKKSGANISLIENDDDNKVFYIGFRTPPDSSTGVAHILEHSVLCGSEKYPLKDPFVELAKGSLNTFLNAMTYPDKTVYPVASTNDKDFANLMDVYMDAVLNPNIYNEKKIFEQEGWHYEMEDDNSPITINGVVYNEMKGAFSNPDDVLERELFNSLFPDTAYGFESGGDPKVIPELTYEDFIDFHKRYYHPSNSYIYLYGDCDMAERLTYLDRAYLSKYDRIDPKSEIKHQESFKEPREVFKSYPIAKGEPLEDNTYLSLNFVTGSVLDPVLYQALDILDYALLNAPGAPLRKALLDAGIGKDIMGGFNSGILQPIYSISVKGANTSDLPKFLDVIKMSLENVIEAGLDKKALMAGINSLQFVFREADFGGYPKGLLYGLINLDSWLYNKHHPFLHLSTISVLNDLKKKIDTGYFEELINILFLENNHASVVVVEPKEGLTTIEDEELAKRLDEYKKSLSSDEISSIISRQKELKEYQDEPESPENLEKIPLLEISDLNRESRKLYNRIGDAEGTKVIYHDIDTNGIHYLNLLFDIGDIEPENLSKVSFMTRILGLLDTMERSFGEYANEVNLYTGGISANIITYTNEDRSFKPYLSLRSKFLDENLKEAVELVTELMLFTKFDDKKRIHDLLNQEISSFQMKMMSAGHSVALMRASADFSASAAYSERIDGIEYYKYLKDFEKNFDSRIEDFQSDAKKYLKLLFRKDALIVSATGSKELTKTIDKLTCDLKSMLSAEKLNPQVSYKPLSNGNEGFKTASQIQYVCRGGNFTEGGLEYTGALFVLKTILSYEYLWHNVRVKGGAYGCMNNFSRHGDMYFVSYRDPNLKATDEIFDNAAEYISSFEADDRDMTKYIIGTISSIDAPLTPYSNSERSLSAYMRGLSYEDIQKSKDEVLSCDINTIRELSEYIKCGLNNIHRCVLGNEDAIEKEKDLFDSLETLA